MSSHTHNQALEPIGLQSLAGPEPVVSHEPGLELKPAPTPGVASIVRDRPLSWADWARGLGIFAGLMGLFGAVALAIATVTALLHKLFKALMTDQVLAANWGNSVGTIVMIVLVFVMVVATLLTMGERKWSALMQDRIGPNRARLPGLPNHALWGLPHIGADVLKMLTKEETVPAAGNKILFHLAPAIAFAPALVLYAVIPMSPAFTRLGEDIVLQVAMLDQGLLYIFAIASVAVFGTTLAGWASNNKYALFGGIRASAQMVSYEVTLGLTLVGLMIVYQSLRPEIMVEGQGQYIWGWLPAWGVLFQPLAIFAYFAAASAEIKRAPFDLPEGESEIVGYFVEYSGLKFGIFMIAEFVEVVVFAGLFTTLFFGGWHLPWGEEWIQARVGPGWMGIIYAVSFIAKTVFFCWLSLVVRWTFPRFRYDQVMDLGWKMLLPLSLANVVLTGVITLWGGLEGAAIFGLVQVAVLLFFVIGGLRLTRSGRETLLGPALPSHAELAARAAHH